MSSLTQASVNEETDKRVLFFDHVEGKVPAHEALELARHIAKKISMETSGVGGCGPTMTL